MHFTRLPLSNFQTRQQTNLRPRVYLNPIPSTSELNSSIITITTDKMPPPTRSHLRIYTSNSSNSNRPSSEIFPIHPPGPSVASYAIRHNTASDTENVGLVVGRLYTDTDLPTTPLPVRERRGTKPVRVGKDEQPVRVEGDEGNGSNTRDTNTNAMDEIWRLRKKEQEELDLLSPALLLLRKPAPSPLLQDV